MRPLPSKLTTFLSDTRGAVTVDYVILTAAVAVAAITSADELMDGLRAFSGDIQEEMSGDPTSGQIPGLVYSDGFDNGANDWVGLSAEEIEGIGYVLGPLENTGGGIGLSRTFQIHPAAQEANFLFDFLSMDDFDGDKASIYVDGLVVGEVVVDHGNPTFTAADGLEELGIEIGFYEVSTATHLGGDDGELDSRAAIEIIVTNPEEEISIGFGSNATAGAENEFFAIDNFMATGLFDPDEDLSQYEEQAMANP